MKRSFLALVCMSLLSVSAIADEKEKGPLSLSIGSWVCDTAQTHDAALAQQKQGANVFTLQKELLEKGQCIYLDDDHLEDMMQPFVKILEQKDGMSKVTFIVEHYKRIAMLHRKFTRMQYTGWTASKNIKYLYDR